jgi:carbamoyltransferase
MIVMERYKDEETCSRVPAVCHVDKTARPQTVTEEVDKNWYRLIKEFGKETGEYIVLNTSFNLGGEPLVETPLQAIYSFTFGGFDALWLQGYLIYRR